MYPAASLHIQRRVWCLSNNPASRSHLGALQMPFTNLLFRGCLHASSTWFAWVIQASFILTIIVPLQPFNFWTLVNYDPSNVLLLQTRGVCSSFYVLPDIHLRPTSRPQSVTCASFLEQRILHWSFQMLLLVFSPPRYKRPYRNTLAPPAGGEAYPIQSNPSGVGRRSEQHILQYPPPCQTLRTNQF